MLNSYTKNLKKKQGMTAHAASEIEGFLVEGQNAEQRYGENGFQLISRAGTSLASDGHASPVH